MIYKKYAVNRRVLLLVSMVFGLLYLVISFAFLIEPSGQVFNFSGTLERLQELFNMVIFRTLFTSALILLIFIGIPQMVICLLVVARMKTGYWLGIIFGFITFLYSIINCFVFYYSILIWASLLLSIIEIIFSFLCVFSYYKYSFYFKPDDYLDIGKSNNTLVIYYNRDIYIKKYAYEITNKCKGVLYEVKPLDNYQDSFGYFRLVFDSLKKKKVEINNSFPDFKKYKRVYIIIPLVFKAVSSPMLSFLELANDSINNVEYDFVHMTRFMHYQTANEIDDILKTNRILASSTCLVFGKVKSVQLF